ncbi:MAG: DUF4091 domain-containing protein [Candidatus Hydrogenedentes bacterium]|nr:DUF4091 domain-containing protein [Candidatus Hydrogenedentota bacterium]
MKTAFVISAALSVLAAAAYADSALRVWPVDPLEKVFRDAKPGRARNASMDAARGEYASFQIVVRSDVPLQDLRASVTPFAFGDHSFSAKLPRFVGYVPVDRPTQKPASDQLRPVPADYPDPLLEVGRIDVAAGQAQPVWITVKVPEDTAPGTYRATAGLIAEMNGKPVKATQSLSLRVYGATIANTRLWVTEWFGMNTKHMKIQPEKNSDAYYELLRKFARNMAEHRHNVAIISPMGHAEFAADANGELTVDFSEFDKWVHVFTEEGVIGLIEGGHIGWRSGGWTSPFHVEIYRAKDGKAVSSMADPASAEADAFYKWYFPKLIEHLREKGWLDRYVQHLGDEPIPTNIESYKAMAALVRKHAPGLRIVEACHAKDLVGSMDIWVPQLNYLQTDLAHYQERQKAGEEVWFYTCVYPQGEYANRFIELPLVKTRLLHWINFKYGITGYLHWGYNQWTNDSPFTHTTRPHGGPPYLPAGDPWIVYPGDDGPLDSIRFEAMRDGIDDHELLCQLAEHDADAAQQIAEKHIVDLETCKTDLRAFRKSRSELLRRLSQIAQPK